MNPEFQNRVVVPVAIVDASGITTTQVVSATEGGYRKSSRLITTPGNNATTVKSSAASFGGGAIMNTSGIDMYFKLYNKGTTPNVVSDIQVLTVFIPQTKQVSLFDFVPSVGINLSAGFSWALTGDPLGTSPVNANCIVELFYE